MNYTTQDIDILARTLYGEARGELQKYGTTPLVAICFVIVNRYKKKFAHSIKDVCLVPYQFSCWNKNDPNYEKITKVSDSDAIFLKCKTIATEVLNEKWQDITDGCDHYHHFAIKPKWAAYLEPKRIFGSHYFYNLRRI